MLDSHFPDEHVRRFAVSALHEMADDELEDILLQLTQVHRGWSLFPRLHNKSRDDHMTSLCRALGTEV